MKHSNIKKLTKKVGFVIVILAFIIGFSSFSTAPINMVQFTDYDIFQDTTSKKGDLNKELYGNPQATPKSTVSKFELTRSDQKYIVPNCVTKIKVYMWGAGGGGGDNTSGSNAQGGGGGYVTGELDVTPGETLILIVGEGGKYGSAAYTNTYGGGGKSGAKPYTGSGGGRSAIRQNNKEIATAGGGGGGGEARGVGHGGDLRHGGSGGAGGGVEGNSGSGGMGNLTAPGNRGGKGGSQTSGGAGGIGSASHYNGENGSQFQGGFGNPIPNSSIYNHREGGGGGGGYFGGGGGVGQGTLTASGGYSINDYGAAGGGGGSSFIGGLTNASTKSGGSGQLPTNSQQKAAEDVHTYNNEKYGKGGDVEKNGQNGFIVIEIIEDNTSIIHSASGSLNACRNVPISNITHSTDKVTGIASTSGLPNGLAASYSSNTITISGTPTALGTFNYIITPTGCGSPIAKATGTIIVRAESIATLTTSNMNSCHGREISLGGYVGKTGAWTLTLNDGSTVSGNGNTNWSKTVQPSATTTYSISSLTGSTSSFCPNMFSGSTTITLPPAGNELAKNGESATCLVSGNKYIHFFHSSGRLIGSINPNGQDLGMVEMTMFDNGTSQLIMPCGSSELSAANSVMNKHWLVNQSKITINNVDVRLPFTKFDYTDLEIAANANFNQSDNIAGIGDIRLSKYNGLNENQSALDNCSNGTTLVYEQIGYNQILTSNNYPTSISNSFFVQYRIPGFSELWLHGATDSPLPVELTHFSADCEEELILNWTTASELNSDQFIIEKSRDGMNWKIIETQQAAGNSNIEMYYSLADNKPSNGLFYYRLRQVDFDGEETIYGPISVFCENGKNSMIVFPNPTNGRFTVEIISQENIKDAKLILLDMIGRIIIDKTLNITKGMNQVYFDEENINPGFYTIQLIGLKEKLTSTKVVKK